MTGYFGLSAYAVVGAGAKFGVNSDGFSVCVEGGLGAGGSVELDPFGGLDPPGTVTKVEGELSVGAGLATAGFKATASLDSAGCGKAGVEARLGPITTDLGTGSTNVNPQLDIHGVPKFDVGAEAQVKAVAQHCWRASW